MRGLPFIVLPCAVSLLVACSPRPSDAPDAAAPEAGPTATPMAFEKALTLHGVTFRVSCPNRGSLNELRIEPEGLTADNSPVVQEVAGTVTGAEVGDLDTDGSPEIYVYVQSAGSGSYGSLVAVSANDLASLSGIHLPDLADDEAASAGYMGHDQFAVVESRLVRRFPIYREGDPNTSPTGGAREVSYRLEGGEAGWALRIDRVRESR